KRFEPASGAGFLILPAQNASGNWVKVVQRIPVRIAVEQKPGFPALRSGMSVVVEIDTGHKRSLAELWGGAPAAACGGGAPPANQLAAEPFPAEPTRPEAPPAGAKPAETAYGNPRR